MRPPIGAVALAAAAAVTVAGCGLGSENTRRLQVLERDPVLHCPGVAATPWLNVDQAGTTHGIGFGGTSPTEVSRVLHPTAVPEAVVAQYATCARAADWQITQQRTTLGGAATLTATKRYEGKWLATLYVEAGPAVFRDGPAVSLFIETDPV